MSTERENTVPTDLRFGHGFRVQRRDGETLIATSLSRIPGGLYARLADHEIQRVDAAQVDWGSCVPHDAPAPGLVPGDHLLVESPAGSLRGELVDVGPEALRLRLPHGAELPVPLEPIQRVFVLLVKADLQPGDLFEVKSKSGNFYSGLVQQRISPERILVELDSGKTVDLRLERLRLDTLQVRLAIPTAYLHGESAPLEAAPRGRSGRIKRSSARLEAAPPRRGETERLQRALLEQSAELERLREERERLEQEKKERERELESEVWRGLAVNRDLAEANRRLEDLERKLETRRARRKAEES